ncbi:MAG: gas vesicle protein [Desulfobaccales bacterium]
MRSTGSGEKGPATRRPAIRPESRLRSGLAWEEEEEHLSLCEALDRILTKGAVVSGEVLVSVADVDLLYLGLQLVITSIEGARRHVFVKEQIH